LIRQGNLLNNAFLRPHPLIELLTSLGVNNVEEFLAFVHGFFIAKEQCGLSMGAKLKSFIQKVPRNRSTISCFIQLSKANLLRRKDALG